MFRAFRSCSTLVGMLVLVAIAVFVYRSITQPAPAARPPSPSAAAALPPPAAGAAVDARLASAAAGIRQAAAAGRHAPVSFTITDPEMTARVNQALANGEVQAPVANVQVRTVPNQVNIAGQVRVAVANVPFTMTAVPQVSGGKAQLQATGVDFGGLPVPGPIANQLTSAVGTDNLLGDLPLTVTSFRAEPGQLVLEGTT